jgi:hypothetical protein
MIRVHFILGSLLAVACSGADAASGSDTIPPENLANCHALCGSIGGSLQSIVIVADETGCVCSPGMSMGESSNEAAAVAGGAVVTLHRAAQARVQQQQQQQRRR